MTEYILNRIRVLSSKLYRFLHKLLNIISHEWLLTFLKWPNGGDVILVRTFLISLEVYLFTIGLKNMLDPTRAWSITYVSFANEVLQTGKWFGPIFAAVYASLYARFSSQWTYLSGVYNRIKETEARGVQQSDVMAEWKAGFIEDAEDLHLARKPMFLSTIKAWIESDKVRDAFVKYTNDGNRRLPALLAHLGISADDLTAS